jgi:transposase
MVERLDLAAFYEEIASRGSDPGRPATDPMILLALWLYATAEGVGSARELERLCRTDAAYQWICGGVRINHHTLSDFRVDHGEKLDDLMSQALGAMMAQGLVTLRRVAHDGMRVRASAGAASFRRRLTLEQCVEQARQELDKLKKELADHPGAHSVRERAAKQRAAEEREAAVRRALDEMALIEKRKAEQKRRSDRNKLPRVSTSDPEARLMKMADGGFRPAYNVQLATDVDSRVIVGVDICNRGTDMGLLPAMLDQIERRTKKRPKEYLVDGGFVDHPSINKATDMGVTVYGPPMEPARPRPPGSQPKPWDSAAVAAWRLRMQTDDAKAIYKNRASTAETVNADLRHWRTLGSFNVRGLLKARCTAIINALTYNLLRWQVLASA